jgi:uncharacterized protein
MKVIICALAIFSSAVLYAQSAPIVDSHQHLFSPAVAQLAPALKSLDASDLIALLDEAGIERALVLSVAYQFGNPNKPKIENEYEQVKAENDWTSQQVARYPGRLWAFCGVNPLKDYALEEIERCAQDPRLRRGIKLHFGNSDVDLDNPQHVNQLRRVFRAANEHGMAIVVHLHPSITRKRPYGAMQAKVFLNDVLPSAPNVPVQIAHLAGAGGYDEPAVDEALSVFVGAIAKKDKHMTLVYFDVSGVAGYGQWAEKASLIARRIRQLGIARVLYGSDGFGGSNLAPCQACAAFRKLPLSDSEFNTIANNLAPYMK